NKDNIENFSVAFGANTIASGNASFAMGLISNATGSFAVAMGNSTLAQGNSSFAIGSETSATGVSSTAMGFMTNADGDRSTAMGTLTNAIGANSTSLGSFTDAFGENSTAFGSNTTAFGTNSVAIGSDTYASGILSVATGLNNESAAYTSLSLGRYNDPIATSSKATWVATDPVFIIGNGTSDNDRKNAITILKNAKTGINTSAPLAGLHIKGVESSFDSHIRLETAGGGEYGNILYDGNMKFRNFGADDEYQWRNSASSIRMRLFDNGDLTIAGTLTTGSDARLKKDIKPINNALSVISGINGYTYQWVDESRGSLLQSGVIAQEIEGSLPHLVRTNEADEKSVNYIGMIPYLIEAVKDLKKENEELKKLVEKLLEEKK
ncbi:MAG: tail fiber domain-containing protein, partial [Saprospiraceae bacterium]